MFAIMFSFLFQYEQDPVVWCSISNAINEQRWVGLDFGFDDVISLFEMIEP